MWASMSTCLSFCLFKRVSSCARLFVSVWTDACLFSCWISLPVRVCMHRGWLSVLSMVYPALMNGRQSHSLFSLFVHCSLEFLRSRWASGCHGAGCTYHSYVTERRRTFAHNTVMLSKLSLIYLGTINNYNLCNSIHSVTLLGPRTSHSESDLFPMQTCEFSVVIEWDKQLNIDQNENISVATQRWPQKI